MWENVSVPIIILTFECGFERNKCFISVKEWGSIIEPTTFKIRPRAILPTGTITACNENKVRHLQVLIHCVVEKGYCS